MQLCLPSAQRNREAPGGDVLELNQRQMRAAGAGGVTGVLEEDAVSLSQGSTLEHSLHFRVET